MKIQPEDRDTTSTRSTSRSTRSTTWSTTSTLFIATTKEVPAFGRGTSFAVSFVVAMNRVDAVDLVVDLVDVGLVDVVPAVFSFFGPRLYFWFLAPGCIFGFWRLAVFLVFGSRLYFWLPCSIFSEGQLYFWL